MGCSNSQSQTPVSHAEEVATQDFHDKYFLGAKLGRGAFAQVRTCTKITPGPLRTVGDDAKPKDRAVKILDLREKDKPDEVSAQLQKVAHKEATVWKAIGNHPNCIRLYDLFFGQDFAFMVMEKCNSGLLPALENMPELTERGLGNVFGQMLLGIAHCHSVKVVHRDVKPDNFLVGGEDGQTVKLGDFGLSATLPKQGKLPGVFGTAPFMCPEMLVGRWYDEKADVWSFAVIVYVLLFGQFPYMPKQQSSKAMKQAIIDGTTPPPFETSVKGLSSALQARSSEAVGMTKILLNREPENRPTAEEALHMPWMRMAMNGTYMEGQVLPSLRPMLHSAKKVGAFEVRDPARDTNVDAQLNAIQMQKHGQGLPPTLPAGMMAPERRRSQASAEDPRAVSKAAKAGKLGRDWENSSSSRSTTDGGSSNMNDSNSDRGFQHGSGWSKNTKEVSTSIADSVQM